MWCQYNNTPAYVSQFVRSVAAGAIQIVANVDNALGNIAPKRGDFGAMCDAVCVCVCVCSDTDKHVLVRKCQGWTNRIIIISIWSYQSVDMMVIDSGLTGTLVRCDLCWLCFTNISDFMNTSQLPVNLWRLIFIAELRGNKKKKQHDQRT